MDEIKLEACVEEALGRREREEGAAGGEGGGFLWRGLFNSASNILVYGTEDTIMTGICISPVTRSAQLFLLASTPKESLLHPAFYILRRSPHNS